MVLEAFALMLDYHIMIVPMVSFLECNRCSANLDIVVGPKCKICVFNLALHQMHTYDV